VGNSIGIFRVVGGKVTEAHFAWDKYELLQQLGALAPSDSVRAQSAV